MTDQGEREQGAEWQHGGAYEPPKSMAIPLSVGGIVQFVVSLGLRPEIGRGGLSHFAGYSLGAIIPGALILYFAFGRDRDPQGWWKIPLVLWPVTLLALMLAVGGTREAEQKATNSIAVAGERMIESGGLDPGPIEHSGATGTAGMIERLTLDMFRATSEDLRSYQREIEATGIAEVLGPAAVRSPADVSEGRRRLEAARVIVTRYRQRQEDRVATFERRIQQADITERDRQDMLTGFREGVARQRDQSERSWAIERQILDEFSAALDVLARGSWQRSGREYRFSRGADLSAFNARMATIERIAAEQQQIANEQMASQRESLRRMPR